METNSNTVIVAQMREEDLGSVLEIQAECYTEVEPESFEAHFAKLSASPSTCFVARTSAGICGYILALPWTFDDPPPLDSPACQLPQNPDTLYIHDLALSRRSRGSGAGKALVDAVVARGVALSLPRASLIAVQDSRAYWERQGFVVVTVVTPSLAEKVASYGLSALYMERWLEA